VTQTSGEQGDVVSLPAFVEKPLYLRISRPLPPGKVGVANRVGIAMLATRAGLLVNLV
jgi:hypothetical protein